MWIRMRNATLPLLLIAALIAAPSCIFDPKPSDDPPVKKPVEWPDMTNRDHVIKTIVLCYENPTLNESMTRYEGLLHSQYFFAFDEADIDPELGPILPRALDIESTAWLFDNQTLLELTVAPEEGGTWEEYPEINGEPCTGCWAGERDYTIRAQIGDEDLIYQSSPGSARVIIVVAPDEGDSSKWVLRAIYDVYDN